MRANRNSFSPTSSTILLALVGAFFARGVVAREHRARGEGTPSDAPFARPNQARAATMAPMMKMPLVVPLFIEDQHFSSTLVLVNQIFRSTFADVVLRGLDGREIARQRVEFPALSQQRVEIGELLLRAGSRATTGSITIMQSPDLKAPVILAQLTMTYSGSRVPNFIDEEIAMPTASSS